MATCKYRGAVCLSIAAVAVSLLAVVCCQPTGASGNDQDRNTETTPQPYTDYDGSGEVAAPTSGREEGPTPDFVDIPTATTSGPGLTVHEDSTEISPSPENSSENGTSDANHSYSIECNPGTKGCASQSLDQIAEIASSEQNRNKSFTIYLNISQLTLDAPAKFNGTSKVAILGRGTRLNCITQEVGIEMTKIRELRLEDIKIEGCGLTLQLGTSSIRFRAALHVIWCHDVTIGHTSITHSNGTGINLQRNTGNVVVRYSNVTDNIRVTAERNHIAGSGVIVYITSSATRGSKYHFVNCTFARNLASGIRYNFILSTPHISTSATQGRGGGMRVTVNSRVKNVCVMVVNCTFEKNTGFLGAGMSAEIEGKGTDNAVLVQDTIFKGNGCPETMYLNTTGIGGGIYLSFEGLNRDNNITNYTLKLTRVTFDSNCAKLGGGTYFFCDPSRTANTVNQIQFHDCTWQHNYAHTGSAVDITPNIFRRTEVGYLTTPLFRNCKFINNTIYPLLEKNKGHIDIKRQSYGSGTLYSSLTSIEFQSNVLFQGNFGSGIIIVNGNANFSLSNATFTENQGIQGGAILLIGTASMIVGSERSYVFRKNKANDKGGAINSYLVDDTDFLVSRSCFIRYHDSDPAKKGYIIRSSKWTASLKFEDNTALHMGNAIFATSVLPCRVTRNPNTVSNSSLKTDYRMLDVHEIFQPPGINANPNDIVTEASVFQRTHSGSNNILRAIPGNPMSLGVRILDDFSNKVQATLTAFIHSSNGSVEIDSEFSCITEHTIKLNGDVSAKGKLVLQTTGPRKISLTMDVELQPCPPGFKLDKNKECKCRSDLYVGIEMCIGTSAYLTNGFWAGFINEEFGTSICPVGFCSYNSSELETDVVALPENSSELEEAVCGQNRRGILCGMCQEGYTTFYHSPNFNCRLAEPVSCRLGWMFYFLSELLPVTLLFLFVLILNISFTTGAVNGFILFSQMLDTLQIDASGVIKFSGPITVLTRGYQIIYGFFTLDLFTTEPLSFCLWKNATVLDMLAFKYITVAYSLLLVISVILFMKYKAAKCFGRYYSITALRNSVIHGLSGFLVLCYAQCINVSFSILYGQDITLAQGTNRSSDQHPVNRVFFNGNITYMGRKHLPYAIPAIMILLVIGVFPPLILLWHPLLNRVFIMLRMEKLWLARCLACTSKLKPLLDSFQGSFKDNFRFFAGVYFFYRWVAALTYAIVSKLSLFYTVVQALLIIILVVHSVCQPYQKRWHNILDALLFANLVVINGLTSLHYYSIRVDGQLHDSTLRTATMNIQVLLIYLPLVYITGYIIVSILGKTCCKTVKDQPTREDIGLKKIGKRIYHSSFSGSEEYSTPDDSLPYRLVDKEEKNPFEETTKEKIEEIMDSYQ